MFLLRSEEREPRIVAMADEYPTHLALVAEGHGCALIPRLGRGPLPEGVAVLAVQPPPVRRIYAVWRSDAARRPAIRAAVDALRCSVDALNISAADAPRPATDAPRPASAELPGG